MCQQGICDLPCLIKGTGLYYTNLHFCGGRHGRSRIPDGAQLRAASAPGSGIPIVLNRSTPLRSAGIFIVLLIIFILHTIILLAATRKESYLCVRFIAFFFILVIVQIFILVLIVRVRKWKLIYQIIKKTHVISPL